MPELPDITRLHRVPRPARRSASRSSASRIRNPFLLRTVDPPLEPRSAGAASPGSGAWASGSSSGSTASFPRHPPDDRRPAALDAAGAQARRASSGSPRSTSRPGTLMLTEAGTKRRASLHLVRGEAGAASSSTAAASRCSTPTLAAFAERLTSENHTLKRALTDPRLFSGIGNAYSDEILHRARLSPLALTRQLDRRGDRAACSRRPARRSIEWTDRLRAEAGERLSREGDGVPDRDGGARPLSASRARSAARRCSGSATPTTRPTTAPACQTGGRLLADRALSRLLQRGLAAVDRRGGIDGHPSQELACPRVAPTSRSRPTAVRWRICALMIVVSFVAYLLRTNMSVAGAPMAADLGLSHIQLGLVFVGIRLGLRRLPVSRRRLRATGSAAAGR